MILGENNYAGILLYNSLGQVSNKYYLMKYNMTFMCKYSNEMMRSITTLEVKYFTIGLVCGEENVLIAYHFHKCELKEK